MKDIEKAVVSSLMWDRSDEFTEITDGLTAECFTDKELGNIFLAMQSRTERGEPINDPVLIWEELTRMGHEPKDMATFTESLNHNRLGMDTRAYITILIDRHQRSSLKDTLMRLARDAANETLPIDETMSRAMEKIAHCGISTETHTQTLSDAVVELMQRVDDNISGRSSDGMQSGLRALDQYGGLRCGNLIVLAAESSQGKTAMALTILRNAAELSGIRAVMYSLEMSTLQLTARLVSRDAHLPASVILYRGLKEGSLKQVDESIAIMNRFSSNIFFDQQSVSSLQKIKSSIRLHVARYDTRLVVIDYLQIMDLKISDFNRHELAIADAARQLQRLAKELDICIILLSQLSRDMHEHLPTVDRIRGSGQINEASDLTLLVYRPEVMGLSYPSPWQDVDTRSTAMLRITKDRFGSYGGVRDTFLHFEAQTTTFTDLTELPKKNYLS